MCCYTAEELRGSLTRIKRMKLVNQRGLGQRLSVLLHEKLVAQRILYATPPALIRARVSQLTAILDDRSLLCVTLRRLDLTLEPSRCAQQRGIDELNCAKRYAPIT